MIFWNQAGYLPDGAKGAVSTIPTKTFTLVSETGETCYQGNAVYFGEDMYSRDQVYQMNFSDFTQVGKYHIVLENGEQSGDFEIAENVYDAVEKSLLKAYYYLRCGTALEEKYAGVYQHAKCHDREAVLWEDHTVSLEVTGGWHDAGDYGRYVTAGACALGHLLYAYKLFPEAFALSVDIPESGNGVPDLLNECRWELEWMLKMQREDGAVFHKVTTAEHAPFIMPECDREALYVFAVSSMATADFCGACALAAEIYRTFDAAFADRLAEAARQAYNFLEMHSEMIAFHNPVGNNTGEYDEEKDDDNRFWAAAQMYALTGEQKYRTALENLYHSGTIDTTALGYGEIGGLGALAYLFGGQERQEDALGQELQQHFLAAAGHLAELSDQCGYKAAMEPWNYSWGSNMNLLKHGMLFAMADRLEGKRKYYPYAQAQWDYLFGVNALGYSYVTGVGTHCVNAPHYRPSCADGIEKSVPGLVSGGPNGEPSDPDAIRKLAKGTPPMKCFVDDADCYSMNEVTIYWNSTAVFLGGYLRAYALEQALSGD